MAYYHDSQQVGSGYRHSDQIVSAEAIVTTPTQFSLGADVADAEPSSSTRRSFVVGGITQPEDFDATGAGIVSLTENGTYGASVEADAGDTVWFELDASAAFEADATGGVECNGVSDEITVTVRAEQAPVLESVITLSATVGEAFSSTLSTIGGDPVVSREITGGPDELDYSLTDAGVLTRAANDTAETETITNTATNTADTSNEQTVNIVWSGGVIPTDEYGEISGLVSIDPFYINSTNLITVKNVVVTNVSGGVTSISDDGEFTIYDAYGIEVSGQSWPSSLTMNSPGDYAGLVESDCELIAGKRYKAEVVIGSDALRKRTWSIMFTVISGS